MNAIPRPDIQARYAEFVSWLYQDSGDFPSALYWTDRALEWANTVQDRGMSTYILARKAQLCGDMHDQVSAIDFGESAATAAPPGSRLRAAALTYAAHGHALSGSSSGADRCLHLLDKAQDTLTNVQNDPDFLWASWLNASYIEVQRARCLSLMGRHTQATVTFAQAVATLPSSYRRDRGVYLARQALAHAGARQPEQAAEIGVSALAIASDTRSGRIINELVALNTRLNPWSDVATVVDFRSRLAITLPSEKA